MPISSLKHFYTFPTPLIVEVLPLTCLNRGNNMGKVRKEKSDQDSTDAATSSNWSQLKKVNVQQHKG